MDIVWEYRMVFVADTNVYSSEGLINVLNAHGAGGWELTSYNQDAGNGTRFLMKRRKAT